MAHCTLPSQSHPTPSLYRNPLHSSSRKVESRISSKVASPLSPSTRFGLQKSPTLGLQVPPQVRYDWTLAPTPVPPSKRRYDRSSRSNPHSNPHCRRRASPASTLATPSASWADWQKPCRRPRTASPVGSCDASDHLKWMGVVGVHKDFKKQTANICSRLELSSGNTKSNACT